MEGQITLHKRNNEMPKLTTIEYGKRAEDHAADMCEDIKAIVHRFDGKVPLATAIGVLAIVQRELIDESEQ